MISVHQTKSFYVVFNWGLEFLNGPCVAKGEKATLTNNNPYKAVALPGFVLVLICAVDPLVLRSGGRGEDSPGPWQAVPLRTLATQQMSSKKPKGKQTGWLIRMFKQHGVVGESSFLNGI